MIEKQEKRFVIEIVLHDILSLLAGRDRLVIKVEGPLSVRQLFTRLAEELPSFEQLLKQCRGDLSFIAAVLTGQKLCHQEDIIDPQSNNVVLLFSPLDGG